MDGFSVLLSVYSKERPSYLNEALVSIWDRQTLKPAQIVLVKDGPLTSCLDGILQSWRSKLGMVLCVVELKQNMGLAAALNHGLKFCSYELVARMDTDDISDPERFKKQWGFFMKYPLISVCGGQIEEWSQDMASLVSMKKLPLRHEEILKFAKSRSPINHPSVMFRKSAVQEAGGYPLIYPEDYLLWTRMLSMGYRFANLPDVLLRMRVGNDFLRRRGLLFLKGEIKTYHCLYGIGFIGFFCFLKNCFLRMVLRLSPHWFKKYMYKYFR